VTHERDECENGCHHAARHLVRGKRICDACWVVHSGLSGETARKEVIALEVSLRSAVEFLRESFKSDGACVWLEAFEASPLGRRVLTPFRVEAGV
jgi:hypothetical protein